MADWRAMQAEDLAGVMAVADQVHPDLPESADVMAEKRRLWPQGAWVLGESGGQVRGYLFAHPWARGTAPALNSLLGAVPDSGALLYIHDLAIDPALRGGGHAARGITQFFATGRAAGFQTAALVSVYGTAPFWGRFGFAPAPIDPAKLRPYGEGALYMTAPLV